VNSAKNTFKREYWTLARKGFCALGLELAEIRFRSNLHVGKSTKSQKYIIA